jgi:hypothetical protein
MSIRNVDRTYFEMRGKEYVCNSLEEDLDPDVKPIEGMTRDNRLLGHSQGNPKFKLTVELAMDADDDTDWEDICLKKEEGSAGIEYEGGKSKTYIDAVVTKVGISSKSGQHATQKLELSARDLVLG